MKYRFNNFVLDTGARELLRDGELVALEPRTYELLVYLLEHRENAVSMDELQDNVWKTIVSESAVSRSIMKLRKVLGDSDGNLIKTVPRFGYRFVGMVIRDEASQESAQSSADAPRKRPIIFAPAALIAVLILVAIQFFSSEETQENAAPVVQQKSVAILPFDDLSEEQNQAWFADGLAEELLNALTRTPDLLVASKTSSFALRDSEAGVREIAATLGVAHIVEGAVRRDNERLRVTAQLIRAGDGFQLWSQTYDRQLDSLIDTQEQIARDIANALETAMDPEALQAMLATGTRNVAAFEAYMRGLAGHADMVSSGNTGLYHESIGAFERAVELDPMYSAAHERISDFWATQLSVLGIAAQTDMLPREQLYSNFRESIGRAIDSTEDPQRKLGMRANLAYTEMRIQTAFELNTRFLEYSPSDWVAQDRHISLLASLGRYDDLIEFVRQVIDTGIVHPIVLTRALHFSLYSGDNETIKQLFAIVEKRSSEAAISNYQMHRTLLWLGQPEPAREMLRRVLSSEMPEENKYLSKLRQACAEGETEQARLLADFGLREYETDLALVWLSHKIMGDDDAAVESLRHFDDEDIVAYSTFVEYGIFDPRPYPNLTAHLAIHGAPERTPIEVPFRCR